MDCEGATPPDAATNSDPVPGVIVGHGGIRAESCYVFKSRLQEYTQKAGLRAPEYYTLKEGPSHEPFFKSTVVVNNTKYDSLPGFLSRKAAEQSAAEVALMEIARSVPATEGIRAVQETGLCKNVLQEYAQKMNYAIPSYVCTKQASGVAPFICAVEVGGIRYIGAAARSKKEAEIKAARTALLAIHQGQSQGCANGATKYVVVPGQRQVKEVDTKPVETPKSLKVRRGGCKKKRNKGKFMRTTNLIVDAENVGGMAGDALDSDVSVQAIIPEELSTIVSRPQPDEEVRRVEHESLRGTTMMQHNEESTIAKQELSGGGTTMIQCNGEPATAKQELPSGTAGLLHGDEVRRVELEISRDTAVAHHNNNKEVRIPKQEPSCDTAVLQPSEEAGLVEPEPPGDSSMEPLTDASIR